MIATRFLGAKEPRGFPPSSPSPLSPLGAARFGEHEKTWFLRAGRRKMLDTLLRFCYIFANRSLIIAVDANR